MSTQLTHKETRATIAQPTTLAAGWRLRWAWHKIRLTVAEMNYAARRVVELQAPWVVDAQRKTR
jgi:hypothetical protein